MTNNDDDDSAACEWSVAMNMFTTVLLLYFIFYIFIYAF